MDKRFLVEEAQPFGQVRDTKAMSGSPCDYGFSAKSLGDKTVRDNHGYNHGPSFADKAPDAQARANAHMSDPYFWTGHPSK